MVIICKLIHYYISLFKERNGLQRKIRVRWPLDYYDYDYYYNNDLLQYRVKDLQKCQSDSFFNKVQVDSEAMNRLEKHVEILAIVFDLSSLEKHVGKRTESVLIRADTVICTENIEIHYNLKIRAREVYIEYRTLTMLLSNEEFVDNVNGTVLVEKNFRLEGKDILLRHRQYGKVDIIDVVNPSFPSYCCNKTKIFDLSDTDEAIDDWFSPLQLSLMQACSNELASTNKEIARTMSNSNINWGLEKCSWDPG